MGKVTVSANGKSVVHKKSGGKAMATIPDVCKVPFPPPVGTVPLPFPNIAESKDLQNGSMMTKFDGGSVAVLGSSASKSRGDQIGKAGGIISGCTKGEAFFIGFSPDVMVEMRPVCRKGDLLIMNKINTLGLTGMNQSDVKPVEDLETIEGEKHTFEFTLIDEEGNILPNETFIAKHSKNVTIEDESNEQGVIKIEGVKSRNCKIKLKDQEEFELIHEKREDSVQKTVQKGKHMSILRK